MASEVRTEEEEAALPLPPEVERVLCALPGLHTVPTVVLSLVASFGRNGFMPVSVRFDPQRCGASLTVTADGCCVTHAEDADTWSSVGRAIARKRARCVHAALEACTVALLHVMRTQLRIA